MSGYGECRVYDGSGNLKQVVSLAELVRRADDRLFFNGEPPAGRNSRQKKAVVVCKNTSPECCHCLACGKSLDHLKWGAKFCNPRCQRRYRKRCRKFDNLENRAVRFCLWCQASLHDRAASAHTCSQRCRELLRAESRKNSNSEMERQVG